MKNTDVLEKKIMYRAIRVAYIMAFLFLALIVGAVGWGQKPTKTVNNAKSYVECYSGKKYSLESAHIYLISQETELDGRDDRIARKLCAYGIIDDYLNKYQSPTYRNYYLHVVMANRGSWVKVVLWWVLGVLGIYLVLNLIRETLLYVIFGKTFSWEWVRKLFNLLFTD